MPSEIIMPKWGLSMQEGTISQWLKQEGDLVEKGEAVLEVETEKMSNVVEATESGVLARILHPAGSVVPVTQVLALVLAPGEPMPDIAAYGPNGSNGAALVDEKPQTEEHSINGAAQVQPAAARDQAAVRAMPAARAMAKDLGIDLATVTGTGPNGAITKADVERAHAAPKTSAAPLPTLQKVAFFSAGHRLDGLLYNPKDLPAGERRPAVVLCVGYTYLKTMVMPDIAKVLTAHGYVAMVFDYRGFGDSDGPRGRLIPSEQVDDARAALTFLAGLPQVDPARLAVVGISLGGAHAISAAALDRRVAAAVALEPPGDGERWLRSLRRHWEWQEFLAQVAEDRARRVLSGESARVDPMAIVVPDPDSRSFLTQVGTQFPQMLVELPLESADALIEYSPEAVVERVAPRPLLIVHGEADKLVPVDEARSLAARAGANCRLEVLPGMGHFDWVMPQSPGFSRVADLTVGFLNEVLPV